MTDLLINPRHRKVREIWKKEGATASRRRINTPFSCARVYISDVGRGSGGGAGRLPWRRLSEGLLISPHSVSVRVAFLSATSLPVSAVILSCHSSTVSSYCCLGTWPRPPPPLPTAPQVIVWLWRISSSRMEDRRSHMAVLLATLLCSSFL